MTDMPVNAPRSDDGHWWWDGSQWQPVSGHPSDAAQQTQGTVAAAPSEAVGQLSDDGQWRWDGTGWQPAQANTAATSASTTATAGRPQITLAVPTALPHTAPDGTTGIIVHYSITNSGTTPIEPRTLLMGFYVATEAGTAETAAYVTGDVLVAIAPGEEHLGHWPLQVDPGTWKLWVSVTDDLTGESLASSDDVIVEVAGQRAAGHEFDDTGAYSLTVSITSVERVVGVLYRVHYEIQSDRDVPVGMKVTGGIDADLSQSAQIYELTTAITAGRPHPHYLTLEAEVPSHSTARIMVDPGGPSEQQDSVVLDIAEDGTPTVSR